MNCIKTEEKIIDYLEGGLPDAEKLAIAAHLRQCPACRTVLEQTRGFLERTDNLHWESPSPALRESFERMLADEKQQQLVKEPVRIGFSWKTVLRVAAVLLLIAGSYWVGTYRSGKFSDTRISQMENQLQELKAEMTLALLNNPSASKRIQAVNYSEELQTPDKKILQAIITRLHSDENVNVRMAAAEALWKFKQEELVKQALIRSLEIEKNPDVQILVIQFLTEAQEKRAVQPMKKLLVQPDLEPYVKDQLSNGLKRII